MSGAEPCTGSNSDGNLRSGFRLADGARPIVPGAGRPEVGQDVAEQVRRHDHVEAGRLQDEAGRQDVDVLLVDRDLRVGGVHRVGAAVPPRHADRDAVALRRDGQLLARPRFREFERVLAGRGRRRGGRTPTPGSRIRARCRGTSRRRGWCTRPRCSRGRRRSRCRRPCAAGPSVDQRAGHAVEQAHRAQVDVLVELAPELQQRPPQRDVVGHRAGQPTAPK